MTVPALAPFYATVEGVLVGQRPLIDRLLIALLTDGHVLVEGVPGLAKTLAVRTVAAALALGFKRVQFTPDLLPGDVIGTEVYSPTTGRFTVRQGPVFTNVLLADEVNRAPAKVQSALLEAMQERSITVGGTVHRLEEPFLVLATQNPIEQEGTYPLPEAQLDRFLFKLLVPFTTRDELTRILDRTTRNENPQATKVMDAGEITGWQQLVREVLVANAVQDYAIRLLLATHSNSDFATPDTNRYLRAGASPRGAQGLILAGKVRALLDGRYNVSFEDVRKVFLPAMRHRVLLNFEAQAENVAPDTVLAGILNAVEEKG